MSKFYYVCLPNKDNVLDIATTERNYGILVKDVTSLYTRTYPKWSCGFVYMVIGEHSAIMKFLREQYFYTGDIESYARFLNEFQM